MSLLFRKTKQGGVRILSEPYLLDDSKTLGVGYVVNSYEYTDDVIGYPTAAQPILGVIESICDKYGNPIPVTTVTAGTAASTVITSVTTASDNTTTKTYWGRVDTSEDSIYSATVSGTLGTTGNSNKKGARLDVDSANTTYNQLLETTATRTISTPANFYSYGLDPQNSARLLVSMTMSETRSTME